MKFILFFAASLLFTSVMPNAAAYVCDEFEVLAVGNISIGGCVGTGTMNYQADTRAGSNTCVAVPVPPVRVLGQQVPGTGTTITRCSHDLGVIGVQTPWAGACVIGVGCLGPCQNVGPVRCTWTELSSLP